MVTLTVQLNVLAGQDVIVPFTVSGTASQGAGLDYQISSSPLLIPAGTLSVPLTLTINDDDIDESNETIIVTLSLPTHGTLGTPKQHTITLTDNDTIILGLAKRSQPAFVEPGERITYTMVMSNTGSTTVTAGQLTDALPAGTSLVPGSLSLDPPGAGTVGTLPNLVTGLTLAGGERVTATLAVTVNSGLSAGTVITNSATLASNQVSLAQTDTVTTTVTEPFPVLMVWLESPNAATVRQSADLSYLVAHAPLSNRASVSGLVADHTVAGPGIFAGGDTNDNNRLDGDEIWRYTVTVTPRPLDPTPLGHTLTVAGMSPASSVVTASTTLNTPLSGYDPRLFIDKDGPVLATVGETVVFTYTVINFNALSAALFNMQLTSQAGLGDGSPIDNLSVTDDQASDIRYLSGDYNNNGRLDGNEGWVYTGSYTIQATDPPVMYGEAIVAGQDPEQDQLVARDIHRISQPPAGDSPYIYLPFVVKGSSAAAQSNFVGQNRSEPILRLQVTGPVTATLNQTVNLTYTLSHAATSDGSSVRQLSLSDDQAGPIRLVSGDNGADQVLAGGETWVYTRSYQVDSTASAGPITFTVLAIGLDSLGDELRLTASHRLLLTVPAATTAAEVSDSDGDGLADALETETDSDGDGLANLFDLESDGDGIPDAVEGEADADGDGLPNFLDLDSDGDTITDKIEWQSEADADGDIDAQDRDADGDGLPNFLDEDSDGDGIADAVEWQSEADGDGDVDDRDRDADGDGVFNFLEQGSVTPAFEADWRIYLPLIRH